MKRHGNIIGTLGFNNFTKRHRANIGYDLQADFWTQGFMTEALKTVIEYGFNELNINRIEAEVMPGNVASEKVLSKIGFKNEGLQRQWIYWNDRHYDMNMFSILHSEFRQK